MRFVLICENPFHPEGFHPVNETCLIVGTPVREVLEDEENRVDAGGRDIGDSIAVPGVQDEQTDLPGLQTVLQCVEEDGILSTV